MEDTNTTGKALIDFWNWASTKGEMNVHTASSYKKACSHILQLEDNWESLDVRSINIDNFCRRFQNKRGKDYKIDTLSLYTNTFRKGISLFLNYIENPSNWCYQPRPLKIKEKKIKQEENQDKALESLPIPLSSAINNSSLGALLECQVPLREGVIANLRLPVDLRAHEVKRLIAFLHTMSVDSEF